MKKIKRKFQLSALLSVNRKFDITVIGQRAIVLLTYVFSVCTAFAQGITGKVVDENNEPMEFVNVVLLSNTDSAYIAGTVTKADGSQLLNVAIWSVLSADSTPDTYTYSEGYMLIPAADIGASCPKYFLITGAQIRAVISRNIFASRAIVPSSVAS